MVTVTPVTAEELTGVQPWADLPSDIAVTVGEAVPALVETIIQSIPQQVPEYARPLEGEFGAAVRRGVVTALERLFLDLPGTQKSALTAEDRSVYRRLGVGEARTGRSLEALLSAYRLGARMTFRMVSEAATSAGIEPQLMLPLGESIFVYFDEISAASVEGFADEQSRQAGERDRRRQTLLAMLLAKHKDEVSARELATRAGWTVPSRVVVIAVQPEHADGLRVALGDEALVGGHGTQVVAVLGEPAGSRARRQLEMTLRGRHAWIGPAYPWAAAGESLRAATLARRMSDRPHARWVTDHLGEIVLAAEDDLLESLAERRLGVLGELTETQQDRLAETLLAWLRHRGERAKVAAELHVHPQTVGYRLGQLRSTFGSALDDPDTRFELEIVLRARAARGRRLAG